MWVPDCHEGTNDVMWVMVFGLTTDRTATRAVPAVDVINERNKKDITYAISGYRLRYFKNQNNF